MSWNPTQNAVEPLSGSIASHLQHRRLLRQDVYDVLVAEFINGDFVPGERIRDDQVAQRLNVSRTPVREALAKLATAGLVDTAPNRYTRTTDLYEGDLDVALDVLAGTYRIGLHQLMRDLSSEERRALIQLQRRIESAEPNETYSVLQVFGRFCAERIAAPTLRRVIEIAQPRVQRVLRLNPEILQSVDGLSAVQRLITALVASDEQAIDTVCAEMLSDLHRAVRAASDPANRS